MHVYQEQTVPRKVLPSLRVNQPTMRETSLHATNAASLALMAQHDPEPSYPMTFASSCCVVTVSILSGMFREPAQSTRLDRDADLGRARLLQMPFCCDYCSAKVSLIFFESNGLLSGAANSTRCCVTFSRALQLTHGIFRESSRFSEQESYFRTCTHNILIIQ